MKYTLAVFTILSVSLAQDAGILTSLGFPLCAVPCIQKSNQAAVDKEGCTLTDAACQCVKAYKTVQTEMASCLGTTNPCKDQSDIAKIQPAGDKICAPYKGAAAGTGSSASGSSAPKTSAAASGTTSAAASNTAVASPTGGKANSASSSAVAAPERTMAAGILGMAGAAAAAAVFAI